MAWSEPDSASASVMIPEVTAPSGRSAEARCISGDKNDVSFVETYVSGACVSIDVAAFLV